MSVGIDIGTGSVRSYTPGFTRTCDITSVKHTPQVVTQSSKQIFNAILNVLPEKVQRISFMATCSMVVQQKVFIDGVPYLKPFNVGMSSDATQDILLWMDSRAHKQCSELNESLKDSFMKKTIGKFIPELGIPKLKWISDNVAEDVYCFELYDWFNYVFQVGYATLDDTLVEFKLNDFDYEHGNAIDGSIKGWKHRDLSFIRKNVKVGKAESVTQKPQKLPCLGDFIGKVSPSILPDCDIYNGGIDCYGGWISTITDIPNSVSMIAGTSTCFVFETVQTEPIDGIWGPFELISGKRVYSFGQPATGKLFEDLFESFGMPASSSSFKEVEAITAELEAQHSMSIIQLIKNYHYYGDKYGNRSPLMDFNMAEAFIDGSNTSPLGVSVTSGVTGPHKRVQLAIKYNLIIEFLAFQTHQLLQNVPANSIIISGSQTHNTRFLNVLHSVTGKDIYVLQGDHSLNVAKGAMKLCGHSEYEPHQKVVLPEMSETDTQILRAKQQFLYDMIQLQQKFYRKLENFK